MQLSTATSAPDSNLISLLPAPAGNFTASDAALGTFADFMPAPVPATPDASLAAVTPILPDGVPGGIAFTLATPLPTEVVSDFVSPNSAQIPAEAANETLSSGTDSILATLPATDEAAPFAPAFSESSRPLSTPTRPGRSFASAAPALRSSRALPRTEIAPADGLAAIVPLPPPPLPVEAAVALPLDLAANPPAPIEDQASCDFEVADEVPARAPAARNQWIMPDTPQPGSAVVGTPSPRRDSTATRETTTFPDVVTIPSRPAGAEFVGTPIDSPAPTTEARPRVSPMFTPERSQEPSIAPVTTSVPSGELIAATTPEIAVIPSAENRPALRVGTYAEKFAAARSENSTSPISAPSDSNKNFLTTVDKEVTNSSQRLGITVAKSSAIMTAPSAPHQTAAAQTAVLDVNVVNAPTALSASIPAAVAATPAEITAAAHKAVDAVLASTERLASATQSSVNLKFSVGGADLDVRVEVRAGAVHATFRTDSPELRTALAQEWQSTNSQPPDHSLRLAAPVFTAGDRSGAEAGTGFSGEQSSQARDQNARATAEFALPGSARGRLASAASAGTSGVSLCRPALLPPPRFICTP